MSFTGAACTSVTGTSNPYIHNVASATTYYYHVRAINSCGSSSWSSRRDMSVGCTAPGATTLYDPGTGVDAGVSYSLSWSSVNGAASYTVCEATGSRL